MTTAQNIEINLTPVVRDGWIAEYRYKIDNFDMTLTKYRDIDTNHTISISSKSICNNVTAVISRK